MIIIDKAVLHIMDLSSGMTVYSDEELSIKDSIETFLLKHIEKSWGSQEANSGKSSMRMFPGKRTSFPSARKLDIPSKKLSATRKRWLRLI